MASALRIAQSSTAAPAFVQLPTGASAPANDNAHPTKEPTNTARRDRLVKEHMSLVPAIASRLLRTLGPSIEFDDLVSCGYKGLLEAAERFDDQQGISFKTYGYYRIRGAMIDALRTNYWYSRADHQRFCAQERAQELAQRNAAFEAHNDNGGRQATNLAGDVAEILGQVSAIRITSLNAAKTVPDNSSFAADHGLEINDERRAVREAVESLPPKERRLIELYYFADKTLEQAGVELGLSKSWVSRVHARAVRLLREALQAAI